MKRQNHPENNLVFSKKQKWGTAILLGLIIIVASFPYFSKPKAQFQPVTDTNWLNQANALLQNNKEEEKPYTKNDYRQEDYAIPDRYEETIDNSIKGSLFYFDPNSLDATGFEKLGLRPKTIQILLNYRNKGGRFKKPEDLSKIYGLKPEEFKRLLPYISIEKKQEPSFENNFSSSTSKTAQEYKPKYTPKTIEINSADNTQFEALYGIGSKLASRIINFREKLGGFYSTDQVGETFGVPDSVFQKIKNQLVVNIDLIKKISLNNADYEVLNNHPYISSKLAYQILKRRKEKGNFTQIEELKDLVSLTTDSYEKVIRYVKIE
ncbi:MAG: helix-hairpin-helix domain-containing protein [Niabella sp.]|nr:MAG: helix-hairpin-helix domain-containing protein [Niabella sp.]